VAQPLCRAAKRLNNDADSETPQEPAIGKSRKLYRIARAKNDSINTQGQIGSRLRYPLRLICNSVIERRAPQGESIQREQHDQAKR